jgi:asparagine synthase (glutamine-hydrolysing)
MCGFTALVGSDGAGRLEEVKHLAEVLRHRGPDDAAAHASGHAALAHRRLAIIDVAGGRQPLTNEDGTVAVVCNGEIYNFRELRARLEANHHFRTHSDSEVIVHLYEERGPELVHELDGMFAFVLVAGARYLAARDPFGIKPLYMGRDASGGVWFASELKALPPECEDVREVPPGSLVTEKGAQRWFGPRWNEPTQKLERAGVVSLRQSLERAVEKRLMSDVPLGVFLSGGLDSSAIAAIVRRSIPALHTFAVGLAGSSDLAAARLVAEHLGTHHHEYVYTLADVEGSVESVIEHLESYDQALVESSVPCFFVSRLASEHVKVVLGGEGADEAFAGYGYFGEVNDPGAVHDECVRLLLGLHNMNLQRVDRMTMAHGIEGRVPFLDVAFIDHAMRLDPELKLRRGRPEKWLLRMAVSDLLPPEIVWRTKQEFAEGSGSPALLAAYAEQAVTDADFACRHTLFPEDTPTTKQAFAFRRIFEQRFPGEARRRTVGRWRGRAPTTLEANGGDVCRRTEQ